MKKRWLRFDGIIREVLLDGSENHFTSAEIHAILKDGTEILCHHYNPTEKDIDILKASIGKEIHVKVEEPPEIK